VSQRGHSLAIGPNLRPVVLGDTAWRAVFEEEWPPEEVLAVLAQDQMAGYLVVDSLESAPALGGITLSPAVSLRRVRSFAAATAQQLALFTVGHGAYHAAVFVNDGGDAGAREQQLVATLAPFLDAGTLRLCFKRNSDTIAPEQALAGLLASIAGAARAALRHVGREPPRATFAIAGDSSLDRRAADRLRSLGLQQAPLADASSLDLLVSLGSAPAEIPATLAPASIAAAVSCESGSIGRALERAIEAAGGVVVPEQLAGAGAIVSCIGEGGPAIETRTAELAESCLHEAAATQVPVREIVSRRAAIARRRAGSGLPPPRESG
jgi:hypothetical protein